MSSPISKITTPKTNRRRFLRDAATGLVVGELAAAGSTLAQSSSGSQSFGAVKQIDAGPLNVGYGEAGPADGPVVVLLHGWPYDIYSYGEVAPILASAGYRVIVPYLRGYGTTRFLSSETLRNAQQSVVALDTVNLMNSLKIQRAIIGGFDWGDAVPTSWRCSGRNAARGLSPLAAI